MMKEKKTYQPVPSKNICLAYELLLDRKFVSFPLTSDARTKIEAIVSNINNTYFDTEIYPIVEEKVVAYLYFLIKDHPYQLAVFIEKVKEDNHQEVIKMISNILFLDL
jgi:hypothetical protein